MPKLSFISYEYNGQYNEDMSAAFPKPREIYTFYFWGEYIPDMKTLRTRFTVNSVRMENSNVEGSNIQVGIPNIMFQGSVIATYEDRIYDILSPYVRLYNKYDDVILRIEQQGGRIIVPEIGVRSGRTTPPVYYSDINGHLLSKLDLTGPHFQHSLLRY